MDNNTVYEWILQTTFTVAARARSLEQMVLAGFLDGTLIDRLGYKRTSILADLANGVTIALIPLLHFTIGLEFWQLLVLVFQGALLDMAGNTVCAALLPDLAEEAGMPIERVTSLTQVFQRSALLETAQASS
jgi:hypothetical protein